MKRLWSLISFIILLFISSNNLYSQIDDWLDYSLDCYDYDNIQDTLNRDVIYNSRYGTSLSPHDTLRMLVIFAELMYSDTTLDPSSNWHNHYWDPHSLPRWADSLFAAYDTTNFRCKRVTRYYQYASSNDHIVLGDYLLAPDNGGVFSVNTTNGTAITSNIVQAVNQKLNTTIVTANGLTSINDFDKWTSGSSGIEKHKTSNGKWDYVVFVVRNSIVPKNPNGSSTSSATPLLGHGIDKACIVCVGDSKDPTHVIRHEYAHMLLGGNNFHTCGGGWSTGYPYNYWIPQTGGWALLGLYGSSLMCWNAWDRQRLGWKATGNQYEISARASNGITEVNGDIGIDNGNGIYVLRDFVTTGDALRIKLPYIDEEKEYPEWIWLENHQGTDNNNIEFDKWQYQDADCVEDFEPGLMAYIQINSDIRESTIQSAVYKQYADYLNPLTANGFWDRQFLSDSVNNGCVSYSRVRPFIRIDENPLTGCGDQSFYSIDLDGDDCLYSDPDNKNKQDQISNWTEKDGNIYHKHLFQLGHSSHSFNLNGNKKISIGTNPSSAPLINMVGQQTQCADAKNLRKTYLNGISIEILEQNETNGNIKVKVCFDDVDIDRDVRWCSDSIVLNNIPTASGYSLNVKNGNSILLDQGLNATRMTNPIMFNGQKIFASPTTFIVQPDVKIHLEEDASIVLDNSSKMHLKEHSSCVIEDQGTLEVKTGTVLQIDDCASLVINGTGMLIVERGAELRISPTAILAFQNGSQNMFIESGAIIPDGYANPNNMISNTISNAVITSSTTWNGLNCEVNGNIVIEPNATLIINSSLLRFNDYDGRIIIKQGGELIIDGSTLKSAHECSDMWQGIEVWGDRNQHQNLVNGGYYQGYLELKNGATIENAVCAVQLWHPNYVSTTGGIVHATDAVFKNNATSVIALNYTNYNPYNGREMSNQSFFKNCDFVVDDDYFGDDTFYYHVELSDVNGIKFEGCDFSVLPNVSGASSNSAGIAAYNAGFGVMSFCENQNVSPCPENSLKRSTFTGFHNGIYSFNEGNTARTFSVRDAVFTNNHRGIYMMNIGYATIIGNEFNIGCNSDCGYGVYADGVSGFCIEENVFRLVSGTNCTTYGVGVFNSESANDVYRNTFENLTCGNVSYGMNYFNNVGVLSNQQGLTYTCNENSNNVIDFYVLKDNGAGGIPKQGTSTTPAGNTFSGSLYHFYNDGDNSVNYFYNAGASQEIPDANKTCHINAYPTRNANDCISHYGSGGVIKSPKEKTSLAEIYNNSEDARERYMAAGDIVRSDLNDSIANLEELRLWLGNMNEIAADRMKVASYIQEGDFKNALALANTLPDVYQLKGDDLADHKDYMAIVNLYQKLYNTNRTVHEMTADETTMVKDIAENGFGTSRLMARGIMMEIGLRYQEPYICPELPREIERGTTAGNGRDIEEHDDFTVSLSPIPATTWVTIDYKLPEMSAKATMTLVNSTGSKAFETELLGDKGTKVLDIRNLPNGVYTYIVRCGDDVKTGKFVIMK